MSLHLRRDTAPIRMRNYGRVVQDMIAYACTLPAGKERDALEIYIAQSMRQRNILWNKDQESGLQRVREDILRLSEGQLRCESAAFQQAMAAANAQASKKKKK